MSKLVEIREPDESVTFPIKPDKQDILGVIVLLASAVFVLPQTQIWTNYHDFSCWTSGVCIGVVLGALLYSAKLNQLAKKA